MNYDEQKIIGTPYQGIGVYPQKAQRCAFCGSEIFGKWCNRLLRLAGRSKGIFIRGLFRFGTSKPARQGYGIHKGCSVAKTRLRHGHIHVITSVLIFVFVIASENLGMLPVWMIVPLGLFAVWCMFVSWVRIMQGIHDSQTIYELFDKMKNEQD